MPDLICQLLGFCRSLSKTTLYVTHQCPHSPGVRSEQTTGRRQLPAYYSSLDADRASIEQLRHTLLGNNSTSPKLAEFSDHTWKVGDLGLAHCQFIRLGGGVQHFMVVRGMIIWDD